jgi:hypothetical protein
MESKDLIVVEVFCTSYKVEITLMDELEEFGLVQMHQVNGIKYIDTEHLPKVEKILRFYNDLKINKEGIEIVLELMDRLELQNAKLKYLETKLKLYE